MCDEALRVTYANGLGEELLREGYLAARDGRLMLADRGQTRRLSALAEPGSGPRCAAFVLDAPDKPGLAAMALGVKDQPAQPFNPDFGPVRIMIVAGVNHRASFAHVDQLRDWFGLTPAEARLAANLAEGGSLEDFSAMRGVSINAARFLLRGIYDKTEVNRLPKLVAKLRGAQLHWQGGDATPDLPSPLG